MNIKRWATECKLIVFVSECKTFKKDFTKLL